MRQLDTGMIKKDVVISTKYILKILLAIVLSSPISLYISFIGEMIFNWLFEIEKNYTDVVSSLIAIPFFFAIFYVVFGLPTTLIADGIAKIKPISKLTTYWRSAIQFLIYTFAGLILSFLLTDSAFDPYGIYSVLIPVYTYFFLLIFIRRKSQKRSHVITN
ncbi:hypothetical protein [Guptibacillus hwajinpoensis]|uniref:Uncharacterized protein n=1 Tax=Guptibacillus hwajinpoensis TaxID=208199 RepID=A0A0J6FUC0_9BACL|nr:hypothetical protein [Alkalihalobacillus macyae]KMM37947.1 hypothetical protein AB986_01015 [Alkalihalobacillus macyae]